MDGGMSKKFQTWDEGEKHRWRLVVASDLNLMIPLPLPTTLFD